VRIVIATECWAPAHAGSSGAAWWTAHGLAGRGHSVEVIAAARCGDASQPGISARVLDATWPAATAQRVALERSASSRMTIGLVQRQLLALVGATTDPSSVDFRGVDGLIGFGVRSPHVRGLVGRALGRVPSAIHLSGEDRQLANVPLIRQGVRGHTLVTHWAELADFLPVEMRRRLVALPAGPGPEVPASSKADRVGGVADRIALLVVPEAGAAHQELAAVCSRAGLSGYRVSGPDLSGGRIDAMIRDATVVILGGGDVGDLAAAAPRAGRPLIVSPGSSGERDARRSGAAFTLEEPSRFAAVLAATLTDRGRERAAHGPEFVDSELDWDRLARPIEGLFSPLDP
jgi:hypothetical protein